ncbi:hypothetical protein LUZ63_003144 [Rhynchospora breviuscula]|uniref:Disease resistance protein winged helix domain-containing protein n=1 Tax=Rhynchospora breviuscula TaxID=2022672 RepID=A0A9Q0HZ54_9POAL|nr:hypothetical protein LUZ63_003144 [Rhynchospora breviuscula]
MGKQFAKKCGGLPLALIVLGGLLSRKPMNSVAWSRVMQTMDWGTDGEECTAVISTSYEDLPFALKSCFMYFAAFSEDEEIYVESLIRMWIAEGFVPQGENKTLEGIAQSFLEDLAQRSMIQVSKRSFDGSITFCRMHDLLYGLAIQKAKEDNFLMACSKINDVQNCSQTRRMAIHDDSWKISCNLKEAHAAKHEMEELYGESMASKTPNMRSLLSFRLIPKVSQLKHLKVLSHKRWARVDLYEPEMFGRLNQLRYVELSLEVDRNKDVYNFQKFISGMRFLQTLDLSGGPICDLPDCIWYVKTLRHVLLPDYSWHALTSGPLPSAALVNLQTLSGVTNR